MKRKTTQATLAPVYTRPQLPARDWQALRDFRNAAGSGKRRAQHSQHDPLWLRQGMRAHLIHQRAGWVVSNPLYSQTLDRHPHLDPSLPGPGWLREVYRSRHSAQVTLPGCWAALHAADVVRQAEIDRACRTTTTPEPAAAAELQLEMFA